MRQLERLKKFFDNVDCLDKYIEELHNNISLLTQQNNYLLRKLEELQANMRISPLGAMGLARGAERIVSRLQYTADKKISCKHKPIEVSFKALEDLHPHLYPVWKELFDNGAKEYLLGKEGNISNWNDLYSIEFYAFINLYLSGRVLDIGAGIYGKPMYLASYPDELVSLLEPLKMKTPTRCEVIQGFCEFLPWEDNTFSVSISGTSLDHVLILEKSLSEVSRVLVPGGLFLVWIASFEGEKPLDLQASDFIPRDKYHLFHFDKAWLEPLLEEKFTIIERRVYPTPGFDHVFYCLQKH